MSEPGVSRDGAVRLVGTAHVSADSVKEVRATIAEERPDVVAVELDEARYRQLKGEGPDDLDPNDLLRGNTVFQFLAYWMLSYVQRRLGERFDIEPGADMKAAVEVAEDHDIPVALVDRDINVTIQRFWARLSVREKISLVGGLLVSLAPPLQIGIALGISVGLLAGLLIGTVGAGRLGFSASTLSGMLSPTLIQGIGVLIAGLATGVLIWALMGNSFGRLADALGLQDGFSTELGGAMALGIIGTIVLWLLGGLALGPLALTPSMLGQVGATTLSLAIGLTVGTVAFGAIGLALGILLDRSLETDLDDLEEFDISRMTDTDVVSVMMEEFRRFSPRGAEALIDERDAFIAHRLLDIRAQGQDVVAVVGAGHVEGIERHLANPGSVRPMAELTERASGRRFSVLKVASYLFMLGFLAFFALLAIAGVSQPFLITLFVAWFLFNGVFAFGAAKLVGARWTSATVGGLIAWLTSINPLLAPGWFAGYVELRYNPVSVGDIGELNELLSDQERPIGDIVRSMFDVPLFRLIMVVAATNVGSMIASALFFVVIVPWLALPVGGVSGLMNELARGATIGLNALLGAL